MFPVMNGLKQGDALSPLLCTFALGCAIGTVQVNQDGLNLISTHSFWIMLMMLIHWAEVYIL
jgi:hypothetical protein